MHLRRLDTVTLTIKPSKAKGKIPVAYPDLPRTVGKGDTIYLADGSIRLEVLRTTRDEVEARVLVGGDLISGKGLNLPKLRTRVPAITRETGNTCTSGLRIISTWSPYNLSREPTIYEWPGSERVRKDEKFSSLRRSRRKRQ